MAQQRARTLLITVAVLVLAAAAVAEDRPARMTLGGYVLESERMEGTLQGPFELSPKVTATGGGMTITCDQLKVWPSPEGKQIERAEAEGNILIRGRYTASDRTEWRVIGKANSASYERKQARAVLVGSVSFQATNDATGAAVSVEAEKLVYDLPTRHFQFVRGAQPVRVEWQEPEGAPAPPAAPAQQQGGKADTKP